MGKGSDPGNGYLRGGHTTRVVTARHSRVPLKTSGEEHHHIEGPDDRASWPKGLQNVGNTCYANAALQCLLSTALPQALLDPKAGAIFRRYSSNPNLLVEWNEDGKDEDDDVLPDASDVLERKKREEKAIRETNKWLTSELKSITLNYTTDNHDEPQNTTEYIAELLGFRTAPVVDPGSITSCPDRLSKCLRPYQQEDAHEFLRALLGTLVMNGQNRQLSSLFDGLLESAVTCQCCLTPSLTRDRYMDLSLDIVAPHVKTLTDALMEFTKCETLTDDNKVFCENCESKTATTKGLRLATAPSILVCHLKRFAMNNYGGVSRVSKKVAFPLKLEIGDFMSRVNKSRPPPYELVAVLVHQGRSCDSGHYIAYVKNNGSWFRCNDEVVEQVDVETVLSQQAYILMYEVAEMRERHGYPSPNKTPRSFRRKSKSTQGTGETGKSSFSSLSSLLLCGMEETVLAADLCCVDSRLLSPWPKSSSRGRRRASSEDKKARDDTTIGDSGSDSEPTRRRKIRRSNSLSGSLKGRSKQEESYSPRSATVSRRRSNRIEKEPRVDDLLDSMKKAAKEQKKWDGKSDLSGRPPRLPCRNSGFAPRRVLSSGNVPDLPNVDS